MKKIVAVIIGLLSGYLIFNSAPFQKSFYPLDYWAKEVKVIADLISYDKFKIIKTKRKIALYRSDDILVVQRIELEILAKELHMWETILIADEKMLDKIITRSTKRKN